jgi:PD-(D/E)XK endonuclease
VVSGWLRTSRHTPSGYRHTTYSSEEVDAVGLYCAELDVCYLVPIAVVEGKQAVHLRLAPCRNNQKQSIHWASQYELGAIAQLGERLAGSEEVAGSSPASSTSTTTAVGS